MTPNIFITSQGPYLDQGNYNLTTRWPTHYTHIHKWNVSLPYRHTARKSPLERFSEVEISPDGLKILQTAAGRLLWPRTAFY